MSSADFEALYRADPDPFGVASSWYERRKQGLVLASLAEERYAAAWDVASGTGHLAAELAVRCDAVLATDASPTAVELTRRQVEGSGDHVTVAVGRLPDVPAGAESATLVVLGEILYYLPADDRATLLHRLPAATREVVAVHWGHHPHDTEISGPAVHEETAATLTALGWTSRVHHREPDFVLDTWVRAR